MTRDRDDDDNHPKKAGRSYRQRKFCEQSRPEGSSEGLPPEEIDVSPGELPGRIRKRKERPKGGAWLGQDSRGKWLIRFRVPSWYPKLVPGKPRQPNHTVANAEEGKRVKEMVDEVKSNHDVLLNWSVRVFKDMDILDHIKEIYRLVHDRKLTPQQYTLILLLRRTLTSIKEEGAGLLMVLTAFINEIATRSEPLSPNSGQQHYTEDQVIGALKTLASMAWPVDPETETE